MQVFTREFCIISKSTFFTEHLCWLLLYVLNVSRPFPPGTFGLSYFFAISKGIYTIYYLMLGQNRWRYSDKYEIVAANFFSVSSPKLNLADKDLISVLFFYNSEPRPDTTVVGFSLQDKVSLTAEDPKQRTKTWKNLEFSCKMEITGPRPENL